MLHKADLICASLTAQVLNLPDELRNSAKCIILAGIIPGPAAPKNFDCFLVPLIEELMVLWHEGVPARDQSLDSTHPEAVFNLRAQMLLCSNDMVGKDS